MPLEDDISGDYTAAAYGGSELRKKNVTPRFKMLSVPDARRTSEEGRPCFKDIEVVELFSAGSKNSIPIRPVQERDKRDWPEQYAAFKAGAEQPIDGTPLREWPLITRAMVDELSYFNIHTVEQLVSMPDSSRQQMMGIQSLCEKAKDWLGRSDGALNQIRDENEALKVRLAGLEKTIASMSTKTRSSKAKALEEAAT